MSPGVARLNPRAEEAAHSSDLRAAVSCGEETLEVSSLPEAGQSFPPQANLFLGDILTVIWVGLGSLIGHQH